MKPLSADVLMSVIIPTYRRFGPLLDTLDDLLRQTEANFEILVADQNPEWPAECVSRKDALRSDPRVRWLPFERLGVVKIRNQTAALARGEILVFVDDDVVMSDRRFLQRHALNYGDGEIAGVAGRELPKGAAAPEEPADDRPPPAGKTPRFPLTSRLDAVLAFGRDGDRRMLVNTFCTCNGSLRADVFRSLGGFDENFTGNSYGDDYDLALRLADAGWQIVYDPACWLIHLQSPMGGLRLSDRQNAWSERERAISSCLFVVKHFEWRYAYTLLIKHLLRKTVFRKQNVVRPWRQPIAWLGLASAFATVWRRTRVHPHRPPSLAPSPAAEQSRGPVGIPYLHENQGSAP